MPVIRNETCIDERPTLGGLFRELRNETGTLIRQEVELARTEISEKVEKVSHDLVSIAVGVGLALSALVLVLIGASNLLFRVLTNVGVSPETSQWVAPLAIGLIMLGAAYAFFQKGLSALRGESLVPERTTESLRENKEWIAHKVTA